MSDPESTRVTDVLLPTDGSECADVAVDHALELASRYGARVHALYVVDVGAFPMNAESVAMDPGPVIDVLEDIGEQTTGEVAKRAQEYGVEVERAVVHGWTHDVILDYADEQEVDLVTMGTHGRRGLRRLLLGSVTERVIRLSEAPILAVPPVDGTSRTEYERILVPVEEEETADLAAEWAGDLAERYDAAVHVLHVVDVTAVETGPDADERRAEGQELVESVTAALEDSNSRVIADVRTGHPAREVEAYVRQEKVDLGVMVTHGRTGVDRVRLGSVTERVLRTTNVPVLTARTETLE